MLVNGQQQTGVVSYIGYPKCYLTERQKGWDTKLSGLPDSIVGLEQMLPPEGLWIFFRRSQAPVVPSGCG